MAHAERLEMFLFFWFVKMDVPSVLPARAFQPLAA
jgi:hypothetical protein